MFDYLQKYNRLPKDLRDKISSPAVMAAVEELEKKYAVSLALVVMKVMVKDIAVNDLPSYFTSEFKMDAVRSARLANEFKKNILVAVKDYLGIKEEFSLNGTRVVRSASSSYIKTANKADFTAPSFSEGKGVSGAHFFFSSEDEEEIRRLAKKIDDYGENAKKETDEEKLAEIIAEVKINFGSQLLSSRFRQVMKTYVRGIRKKVDVREFLVKPIEQGGLSFDDESADRVMVVADSVIKKPAAVAAKRPKRISVPEDKRDSFERERAEDLEKVKELKEKTAAPGTGEVGYDLAGELKSGRIKRELKKLDTAHELSPPPPAVRKKRLSDKSGKGIKSLPKTPAVESRPQKRQTTPTSPIALKPKEKSSAVIFSDVRRAPDPAGKIKMEDVKAMPRVMGPIDELKYMNLVNFRRLSKDPFAAAAKIREKINLLGEEGYGRRTEGVKKWRLSPINRVYLEIGGESISKNKPINAIIRERSAAGKEHLTVQEFEAIMDLNKSLRF